MKKNNYRLLFTLTLTCTLLFMGCSEKGGQEQAATETKATEPAGTSEPETGSGQSAAVSELPLRAMYLTGKTGEHLFVGTENGTLFTAPIPEELYGLNGKKLAASQLNVGTIVDIYGNDMMLYSYPGQFPGVSRMTVVKEGTEADTEPYQYLIDQIYTEPDPSQPPVMNLEYQNGQAIVDVVLNSGGYSWSYTDESGQKHSVTADSPHILEWEQLADVALQKPADLKLLPSQPLQSVELSRWPVEALKAKDQSQYKQETLKAAEKDGSFWISQAEPGYVYLIKGIWENGEVEFGFYTK